MALLRIIYFLIFFAQISAGAAHADTKHSSISSTENCLNSDFISCNESNTESDEESTHHCCYMCHVHQNAAILESNMSPAVFNSDSLVYYYSSTYFSLVQLSVLRPPIA